jgi:hypothetical protein
MKRPREIWHPIAGYEAIYEISSFGRVRSISRLIKCSDGRSIRMVGIIRKTPLVKKYPSLFLCLNGKKTFAYVHHLVATAFIGPRPPGKEVAHNDGNAENVALTNLRYATPVENDADKIAHGTRPIGIKNGHAKINDDDVREIRLRFSHGSRLCDLGHQFSIGPEAIRKIVDRKNWKHIP